MQLAFPQKRGLIPPGTPRVNWSDQITASLMACYVPSAHPNGKTIYNLTGRGADLAVQSAATYGQTTFGTGLKSTTTTNLCGAFVTLPAAFKFADNISLFWFGFINGQPSGGSAPLIGAVQNNAGAFFDYVITSSVLATTDIGLSWNTANTFGGSAADLSAPTTNSFTGFGGTFKVGGNAIFYVNGAVNNSTAFGASAPTYNASDLMYMGNYPSANAQTPNVTCLIAGIWNRVLTAVEMAALNADPLRFLTFPDDDIMALLVGSTAVATGQVFSTWWA